jgi:hypothetical protein
MRHTREVDDDTSREAANLLRRVLEAVVKGKLEARTPDARALLRRLEGALIALEALSPKSESEHVHDSALRDTRVFCTELRRRCPPRTVDLDSRPLFIERHEEGVSCRIDLGAVLGPALTAYIGVTARGVRASHAMHKVPGGGGGGARRGHSSVTAFRSRSRAW